MQACFRDIKARTLADAKRCAKLEKKLDVLLGGYKTLAATKTKTLRERLGKAGDAIIERECATVLLRHESNEAAPTRIITARAELVKAQETERELQAVHQKLTAGQG